MVIAVETHAFKRADYGAIHQQGVAEVLRDQLRDAAAEIPASAVAQLGVGLNDPEELFAADLDHVTRSRSADAHQRRLARERAGLARELSR